MDFTFPFTNPLPPFTLANLTTQIDLSNGRFSIPYPHLTNFYLFYSTQCKNREATEDQVANEFFKPIGLMGYTSRSQNVLLLLAALKQVF